MDKKDLIYLGLILVVIGAIFVVAANLQGSKEFLSGLLQSQNAFWLQVHLTPLQVLTGIGIFGIIVGAIFSIWAWKWAWKE